MYMSVSRSIDNGRHRETNAVTEDFVASERAVHQLSYCNAVQKIVAVQLPMVDRSEIQGTQKGNVTVIVYAQCVCL